MKFLLLFGPQAVGKMTVGEELSRMTGLTLFHNHMTIEMLIRLFPFGSPEFNRLNSLFRREIMEAMAGSDRPGMIFTFVWALDMPSDWEYVRWVTDIFAEKGADILCAELQADTQTRLMRNKTPHRLAEKPTKRNTDWSDAELLQTMEEHRLHSLPGEIPFANYIRIDNSALSPREAAEQIYRRFWGENVPDEQETSAP